MRNYRNGFEVHENSAARAGLTALHDGETMREGPSIGADGRMFDAGGSGSDARTAPSQITVSPPSPPRSGSGEDSGTLDSEVTED